MNHHTNNIYLSPAKSLMFISVLSVLMVVVAYLILLINLNHGMLILLSSILPIFGAKIAGLQFKRLIPDIIFGSIDTGLLTIAALIGASSFGILGAIIGGVVGDAVTDGIAGFFEGAISEWLRSIGIDESRTALGSYCGKMTGCLIGSGLVLLCSSPINLHLFNQ